MANLNLGSRKTKDHFRDQKTKSKFGSHFGNKGTQANFSREQGPLPSPAILRQWIPTPSPYDLFLETSAKVNQENLIAGQK